MNTATETDPEWVVCTACLGCGAIASPRGSNPHAYEERDCSACSGTGECLASGVSS